MRRDLSALVSAFAAVALAAPVAATASTSTTPPGPREKYNRVIAHDQKNDVWLWNPASEEYEHVDGWEILDVAKVVGTHYKNSVVFTMTFLDLKKANFQEFAMKVKTPELIRVGWVIVKPGAYGGTHLLEDNNWKKVSAKGLTHKINYKKNTVRLEIPRSRLSNPRWVRLAFWNRLWTDPEDAEFGDHPANDQAMTPEQWHDNPPYTVRLYPAAVSG